MKQQLWWLVPISAIWLFGQWMTSLYFLTLDQALVVRSEAAIESLADFGEGDHVGVTTHSQGAFLAQAELSGEAEVVEFPGVADAVAAVATGAVEGTIGDLAELESAVESGAALQIVEEYPTAAPSWAVIVLLAGGVMTFGLSVFIGVRRPEVRIGQLFALATAGFAVSPFLLDDIAAFIPADWLTWIVTGGSVLSSLALASVCWVVLLFPTGRHPSRRWWWVTWYLVAFIVIATPVKIAWFLSADVEAAIPEFDDLTFAIVMVPFLAAIASLFFRYRRADREMRAQLGWLLYGVGVYAVFLIVGGAFGLGEDIVAAALDAIFYAGLPLGIAIAIFRYRLYEIDRVVSRTVSYGIVIGLMATVYLAMITVLHQVLPLQEDLAVAVSTLAAVAVSVPVLRRVRRWVDRRFFRNRYDSARVVARVADDLRTTVDLGEVERRTEAVIEEVFAPEGVAVWLAEDRP